MSLPGRAKQNVISSQVHEEKEGKRDERTIILRVLDREEVGLLGVGPPSRALVEVASTVAQGNARIVVAEVLAVELEELDEEDAEVDKRIDLGSSDLGMDLIERRGCSVIRWLRTQI